MYFFHYLSSTLFFSYILSFFLIHYGGEFIWQEGFYGLILLSPLMFIPKTIQNKSSQRPFIYDFFLTMYSFLLAFMLSLAINSQSSDIKGWWLLLVALALIYAASIGLLFAITALLIPAQHNRYAKAMSFVLFAGYIIQNWLPLSAKYKGFLVHDVFCTYLICFFIIHVSYCISVHLINKFCTKWKDQEN